VPRVLAPILALAAVLVLPAPAVAGAASISVRELAVRGERAPAASVDSGQFDLVGLHWRGPGTLELRTRSTAGRWTGWRRVEAESLDGPDAGSAEGRARGGWRLGAPIWVGPSDRLEVRAIGRVLRARAFTVRSPIVRVPLRTIQLAGSPTIVPRSGWLADESIRRAPPQYASAIRMAYVHHTATANTYTREQAPAAVRAIQLYHVRGNGWNDIGYNALVDRFGTVYEGRYGGLERNVVGAHALGFNTGSFGVAVLGDFERTEPPQAALDSLTRLLAWRLDLAHVDPLSTLNAISSGNERFPSGIPVFLRAVSGHRDTGATACPGERLYAVLGEIAQQASLLGRPKLYAPAVTGKLGGPIRFTARLSGPVPWTVAVTDALGIEVARGAGTGATLDWTWDSTFAAAGSYRWEIAGGPSLRGASGSLGGVVVLPPLAFTGAAADPETVTPNEDGQADETTVTYTLSAPATVSASVLGADGSLVGELQAPTRRPAGEGTVAFAPGPLPDGAYTVLLQARAADGAETSTSLTVLVTRTLGRVTLAPAAFSPNADGRNDRLELRFRLAAPALVKVRVLRDGRWVTTPLAGNRIAGPVVVRWDGAKRLGRIRDGAYTAVVEATDAIGTARAELPFGADTAKPVVSVLSREPLRVQVSEPARLVLRVNGNTVRFEARRAGAFRVPGIRRARVVRVVAWDAAGNASDPVRRPWPPRARQ
jgi:N-acetylmuramoyl-L-alanine amidase-like protein